MFSIPPSKKPFGDTGYSESKCNDDFLKNEHCL